MPFIDCTPLGVCDSHAPNLLNASLCAAHVPLYLYPFLNTVSKNRPFEYLRLTSLGVIGALVKLDDSEVINFLLQTEIIPLCLRIMETGSELSKTVRRAAASRKTHIFSVPAKSALVDKVSCVGIKFLHLARLPPLSCRRFCSMMGLNYICATAERFYAVRCRAQSLLLLLLRLLSLSSLLNCTLQVSTVLSNMVAVLVDQPSVRLLKHIVRCYLRLSDNLR